MIRFTFSPDPAWDWIQDQGILEEMEKDSGFRILQTVTWDEYGQFAGGHADVVSIGTYELQNLERRRASRPSRSASSTRPRTC